MKGNKKKITILLVLIIGFFFIFKNWKKSNEFINNDVAVLDENIDKPQDFSLSCLDCNLIIISLTNARKNNLGIYGYSRKTSPNIDRFFKKSIIFDSAFVPSPWTFVNGVSMFTSLSPYSHNILERGKHYDLDKTTFLAEILKENGYTTAGFTSGEDYNSQYSLSKGFDFYLDRNNFFDFEINYEPGKFNVGSRELVEPTINWLEENKDKKFFLFLQLFDLHCPHTPSDDFINKFNKNYQGDIDYSNCFMTTKKESETSRGNKIVFKWNKFLFSSQEIEKEIFRESDIKKLISLYDEEILQADYYLEKLFQKIKQYELEKNTIIIFISEHGEMLGEKGVFNKILPVAGSFNDKVLNFPFLIKHPKINETKKITDLVQTVDIFPTIIDILEIRDDQKEKRQGKSFLSVIENGDVVNDYVYAKLERSLDSSIFKGKVFTQSIRNKKWKLIKEIIYNIATNQRESESYELYDIVNDPEENKNLYTEDNIISKELKEKLKEKNN